MMDTSTSTEVVRLLKLGDNEVLLRNLFERFFYQVKESIQSKKQITGKVVTVFDGDTYDLIRQGNLDQYGRTVSFSYNDLSG